MQIAFANNEVERFPCCERGEYENDPESGISFSRVGGSWEGFFWEHLVRVFSVAVCAVNEARNSINGPSRNGLINTNVTASDSRIPIPFLRSAYDDEPRAP